MAHDRETDRPNERRRRRALVIWRRLRTRHGLAAALALLLLAPFSVVGSIAAWTVSDANGGNVFTATSLEIWDNQGGHAGYSAGTDNSTSGTVLWTVSDLAPGSGPYTKCIGVKFVKPAGSTPTMTLKATITANTGTIDSQLTVNTAKYRTGGTVGTSGNAGSCAGYPSSGGTETVLGAQGGALSAWGAASAESIASPVTDTWYKFEISGLPNGASCSSYCGKSATLTLTWTLSA